ncbi:hypothetical protein CQ054_19890 [Ochrobactrum sp. MYb29]|uniref:type II restriction endonuclease n=1 Tax=Brucella pituitosa TaxID=571256 RepID=UPI000C272046|nr:type II restriction endonuclease [Brucella pituitosa]PJO49371.1 hypothetical protein CWE02_06275 [Brucella pituitosa]PRA82571.1 hypothetical protein CQ054_19890 [Ochrobactrum sp. MYb29]
MLAAKTIFKDRWRQIINEVERIRTKHRLTLQEVVSEAQFREMTEIGVRLVVPAGTECRIRNTDGPDEIGSACRSSSLFRVSRS